MRLVIDINPPKNNLCETEDDECLMLDSKGGDWCSLFAKYLDDHRGCAVRCNECHRQKGRLKMIAKITPTLEITPRTQEECNGCKYFGTWCWVFGNLEGNKRHEDCKKAEVKNNAR